MTLWIGNGAVLRSYKQWQLNEFRKLNNSGHELSIFKIHLIAIDGMNWIYLYFVNKHRSKWPLLGL